MTITAAKEIPIEATKLWSGAAKRQPLQDIPNHNKDACQY